MGRLVRVIPDFVYMKIFHTLLLFLGWLWLPLWSFSQTVLIQDANTQKPLARVLVVSTALERSRISGEDGAVDLQPFRQAGDIEFRRLNYESETYSFRELVAKNFVVELRPVDISLEQVVISATRWQQSRREVPVKVSTISRREVSLMNPQTAADLLSIGREVFIQKSQQGGGSPMIRGFSTNRLLISVDGVRMNTAIFRNGNLQNVISLAPLALEQT